MSATRLIVHIDEEKCDGCGQCVPSCAEGAIQVIEGKARLVDDRFCDGLGACLGECPQGAITLEERPYPRRPVPRKPSGSGCPKRLRRSRPNGRRRSWSIGR